MKNIITIIRPYQWTKNLFVLLPIFFGGRLFVYPDLLRVLLIFVSFCLLSSAVYCINDIADIKFDRIHPIKKNRPLASGKITVKSVITIIVLLLILSIIILIPIKFFYFIQSIIIFFIYLCLNVLYSFKLKHYAIVDVFIIGLCFILRVLAGGVAANVILSQWMILMVFLLSLFLGFAKRKDYFIIDPVKYENNRNSLKGYTPFFLNILLTITSTITIVCYILYTVSPEITLRYSSNYVYISTIFVLGGIFRYLQLSLVYNKGSFPSIIFLKDKIINACVICWVLFFLFLIYCQR